MIGIGEFFKKIRNARAGEISARIAVRDALKKHVGADVPIEKISFKSGAAILSGVNAAARSEIFIKKRAILEEIARTGVRKVTDIR